MSNLLVANIIASVFLAQWKGPTGAAVGTGFYLLYCCARSFVFDGFWGLDKIVPAKVLEWVGIWME